MINILRIATRKSPLAIWQAEFVKSNLVSLYPNLSSPDYAFDNDYFERIKNTKHFKKKDMAPINIKIGF